MLVPLTEALRRGAWERASSHITVVENLSQKIQSPAALNNITNHAQACIGDSERRMANTKEINTEIVTQITLDSSFSVNLLAFLFRLSS